VNEQLLDVKRVLHLVWRHRVLASIFVVVALVGSVAFVFLRPPLYSSAALVLLPGSSGTNGQSVGDDMSTDSQIATSAAVLSPVGARIDPSLSLVTLRQRIHASGTATNVLQITALANTPAEAEDFANSVATHLVKFVTTNGAATNASGLVALQAEAAQLTKQVNDVNGEITALNGRIAAVGASSSAGQADTTLLGSLTAQQSQSTLQVDSINSEIAVAQLGTSAANAGTEVIQKATTATQASLLGSILTVVLGGLIGLAVGSMLIVFLFRGDRRLRRRDQIAEAVGIPVVLSLGTTRKAKTAEWIEFFETYQPSSNDRWRIRKTLRDLEIQEGAPGTLVVLALGGDADSLMAAPQIALCAAALGVPVSLNVTGKDPKAVDLRVAMERIAMSGRQLRPDLDLQGGVHPVGLTVVSMVVDPVRPEVLVARGGVTVLAVSAGFATVEELARVAISAADCDQPIAGIVVTNPEPDDPTTGRLPEAPSPLALAAYRAPARAGWA
jgi:capsular polysaccharide biosynthesis protein